jgi:hypothetical protein
MWGDLIAARWKRGRLGATNDWWPWAAATDCGRLTDPPRNLILPFQHYCCRSAEWFDGRIAVSIESSEAVTVLFRQLRQGADDRGRRCGLGFMVSRLSGYAPGKASRSERSKFSVTCRGNRRQELRNPGRLVQENSPCHRALSIS